MRLRFLVYLSLSLGLLLGLDRLFYNQAIFSVKNPSGWDSFRWYNFERNNRELEAWRRLNPHAKLLLIVGSSIARYAVQAHILEALLRGQGLSISVRNFNHAAMMPADLYFYRERLRHIRPNWILYITNPADLDLERYTEPWQAAHNYESKEAIRFLRMRHPARILYPENFAEYFGLSFGLDDFLKRRLYAAFASLRFREEWMPPVRFYWKAKGGFAKSYLNYQGIRIEEGLWRTGHTIGCIRLLASTLAHEKGGLFRFEVPPALFSNTSQKNRFFLGIYQIAQKGMRKEGGGVLKSNARIKNFLWSPKVHPLPQKLESQLAGFLPLMVKSESPPDCRVPKSAHFLRKFQPQRAGWQALALPENRNTAIWIRLSHLLDRKQRRIQAQPVSIGKGIRLPAFFGRKELPVQDVYVRRPDWDGREIYLAKDKGARQIFLEKNEPKDWRNRLANRQLNFLRLAKYYTNWYRFNAQAMPQARFLRLFLKTLQEEGIKILVVNNPENPVTLADYSGVGKAPVSLWYGGYLDYLQGICKTPYCLFFDQHRALSERYFSDAHHLTYEGMLRMAPLYARYIAKAMHSMEGN